MMKKTSFHPPEPVGPPEIQAPWNGEECLDEATLPPEGMKFFCNFPGALEKNTCIDVPSFCPPGTPANPQKGKGSGPAK